MIRLIGCLKAKILIFIARVSRGYVKLVLEWYFKGGKDDK